MCEREKYRGVGGTEEENDGCALSARSKVERTRNTGFRREG